MKLTSSNDWDLIANKETNYFQSKLFRKHGFNHAFFTKESNNKRPEELLLEPEKGSRISLINQVHGNKIVNANQCQEATLANADGMISDASNQSLWIYTADCIPALIADIKLGIVAAIHAGWRGLAKEILPITINEMKQSGCNEKNLIAALGPAISGDNYQVDNDVSAAIRKSISNKGKSNVLNNKMRDHKNLFSNKSFIFKEDGSKSYIDIRYIAYKQLIFAGLRSHNISISNSCTFANKELFNSRRRDHERRIQWSFICSK